MHCCINYVVPGTRDIEYLFKSISAIRKYCDYDINIFYDQESTQYDWSKINEYKNINMFQFNRIKYSQREENRNSSLYRLISIKEMSKKYDHVLYLDNDILVVHEGFFEGFGISKNFGFCMAENPRTFITTNEGDMGDIDIGADVAPYDLAYLSDMPRYMTCYNMGVMFYTKNKNTEPFLEELINEQIKNPSRGQAGLYRTMWKTKFAPYCLTRNWLACHQDVNIKRPLAVHYSDEAINKMWREK